MELTFSNKNVRELATEPSEAYASLGAELGQAFISLVADFRSAIFVGDVPGGPKSIRKNGVKFELDWFVSIGCTLHTIVVVEDHDVYDMWNMAYRIHLESVLFDNEVIL